MVHCTPYLYIEIKHVEPRKGTLSIGEFGLGDSDESSLGHSLEILSSSCLGTLSLTWPVPILQFRYCTLSQQGLGALSWGCSKVSHKHQLNCTCMRLSSLFRRFSSSDAQEVRSSPVEDLQYYSPIYLYCICPMKIVSENNIIHGVRSLKRNLVMCCLISASSRKLPLLTQS